MYVSQGGTLIFFWWLLKFQKNLGCLKFLGYVYKEVISKVVFYYEISTFDAFGVPVRLTHPIYIIIYCVRKIFFIMKD